MEARFGGAGVGRAAHQPAEDHPGMAETERQPADCCPLPVRITSPSPRLHASTLHLCTARLCRHYGVIGNYM